MKQICITFEGSRVSKDGLTVDCFVATLEGIQDAMRLTVEYLGDREPGPGRPPSWVRDQSVLRLAGTRKGSFVAELTFAPPAGQAYMENLGERAIDALLEWDGKEGSNLPKVVTDRLSEIPRALPEEVRLWMGSVDVPRRVEIKRVDHVASPGPESEQALLHGWLKEVNWDKGTARLRDHAREYVRLRFDAEMAEHMRRLATQYVEVRGRGTFNKSGDWTNVKVEQINSARSWREPFDLEEFLNDPNPKIFDPQKVVTVSEPFDVDAFIRTIHEGRDVGRKESSDW